MKSNQNNVNAQGIVNELENGKAILDEYDIEINSDETTVMVRGFRSLIINGNPVKGNKLFIYPGAEMIIVDQILGGCDVPFNLLQEPITQLEFQAHGVFTGEATLKIV